MGLKFPSWNFIQITKASNSAHGRPSRLTLPDDIRYDNMGRVIVGEVNRSRKKCRFCKNHTIYLCKKCNVYLHPDCFKSFHIKN